ncbi:MAG TPA: MarR family transcriptional regulator [Candidatus Dormibacteraeota bacterium]|jgi:DNA-binding MarR family transcriptional regulator|nr:MarR family transcriptional regulator [Candidatus Dormibacteraeota bacterium]
MLQSETFAGQTSLESLVEEAIDLQRVVFRQTLSTPEWSRLQLSMPRLKALFGIACNGPLTIGGLARELGVSLPTASTLVEALVSGGYVARREDVGDRRRTLAELTPAGERLVTTLREGSSKMLHLSLLRLEEDELEALLRGLRALTRSMTQDTNGTPRG